MLATHLPFANHECIASTRIRSPEAQRHRSPDEQGSHKARSIGASTVLGSSGPFAYLRTRDNQRSTAAAPSERHTTEESGIWFPWDRPASDTPSPKRRGWKPLRFQGRSARIGSAASGGRLGGAHGARLRGFGGWSSKGAAKERGEGRQAEGTTTGAAGILLLKERADPSFPSWQAKSVGSCGGVGRIRSGHRIPDGYQPPKEPKIATRLAPTH